MGVREDNDEKTLPFGPDASPKGLQPRVVFVLLLVGSAAGVWLSHWRDSFLAWGSWWLLAVTLGSLCGGLYWRLVLFDTTDFESDDLARAVSERWRLVEAFDVSGLLLGGIGSVATGVVSQPLDPGQLVIGVGGVLSPLLWVVLGRYSEDGHTEKATYLRWLFFAVVLGSLAGFAWTETGGHLPEWIVRTGHLGVFALWIGGASWHNFVVLPTVRTHPGTADQVKMGARRFRRHLPIVIVIFLVTGVYQAVRLLGYSVSALIGTSVGRLITVKFIVLAMLTGLVIVSLKRARNSDGSDG